MFSNLGSTEIAIVILVLIIIFGSRKVTDLAKGLGESTKELKKVKKQYEEAIKEQLDEVPEEPKQKES